MGRKRSSSFLLHIFKIAFHAYFRLSKGYRAPRRGREWAHTGARNKRKATVKIRIKDPELCFLPMIQNLHSRLKN